MLGYDYHMQKAKFAYENLARHTELFKHHGFGHHNEQIVKYTTRQSFESECDTATLVI